MRVVVTGATGYVGRTVLRDLERAGHQAVPAVRARARLPERWREHAVDIGEIGPNTDWAGALAGAEGVIHLAAPGVVPGDPQGDAQRVIVDGTDRLLRAATAAGVRRLVFLSSVKAVGETTPRTGYTDTVSAAPSDTYGTAKRAAEALVHAAPIEGVILRSPAIYGRGSGGNVRQMIDFLRSAPPVLPLGYAGNRRSLVHRGNLVAAAMACLEHPDATGQTFVATDGIPESTADLTRRILRALKRRAWVMPVPGAVLRALCTARWGPEAARRLVDSYAFDDGALRHRLGWRPPVDPEAAMADAVVEGPDPLLDAGSTQ